MKFSPSTKLAFFSFAGVYLALAIILGSLFVLRSEQKLITQLDEIGTTYFRDSFVVNDFELLDQYSNRFTLENMKGRWSIVFFGFTSCPDICPLTMAELDRFASLWSTEDLGPAPQVIMTTVDPAVDDFREMKKYLSKYNRNFIGLTGRPEALTKFARNFSLVLVTALLVLKTRQSGCMLAIASREAVQLTTVVIYLSLTRKAN